LIHRWIHRRAALAWLLLPWLALLLAGLGLTVVDAVFGDGVLLQDWRVRARNEWLWPALLDLPLLLAGLYGLGSVVWGCGVLAGGRSARRTAVVLGLLCGAGGLALGGLVGLAWNRPASLVLGVVALGIGIGYAALTHRPRLRVQRRMVQVVSVPPPPPAPPPPVRAPVDGPATTVMRHEAPTTQPADY
jgi:hypothetical protein